MAEEELDDLEQQQELYEHHRINVDRGQEPLRIDRYLQLHLSGVSRNKIQAAAKAECILVNDHPVKSNYRVKPLDTISVLLPEPPHEFELTGRSTPLIAERDPQWNSSAFTSVPLRFPAAG